MEYLIIFLVVILIVLIIFTLRFGRRQLETSGKEQSFLLIQQEIQGLRQELNQKVSSLTTQMLEGQKTVGEREKEVSQKLGEVFEATRRIHEMAKDIGGLQDILKPPKMRGGMGELLLSNLLKEIFPPEVYEEQHSFSNGERVDLTRRHKKCLNLLNYGYG